MSDKEKEPEKDKDPAEEILSGPVENFSRNIVDNNNEENARSADNKGLEAKIVRTTDGNCCQWCTEMAGEYEYSPNMDTDVFRRHDNCECEVEYVCEKGRQDVWSKKWKAQDASERNSRIKRDNESSSKFLLEDKRAKKFRIEDEEKRSERKKYDTLLTDVERFYYSREQSALEKIPDTVRYDVGVLPKSDKSGLLDGSKVLIEGQSLKRILNKHGKEFSFSEFQLLKNAVESPDCIASNETHHQNSLLLYKAIPGKQRSVMECVFIKEGENYIIHYHKIKIQKIKKLMKEGCIIENHIQT